MAPHAIVINKNGKMDGLSVLFWIIGIVVSGFKVIIDKNIKNKASINWWLLIKSLGCSNFQTGKMLAMAEYRNKKYIQKSIGRDIGYLIPTIIER